MSLKPQLLLIEDDPVASRLIAAVAERAGFAATTAATGEEALRKGDEIPIDICIVDLNLPDAQGLAVMEKLFERPHLADVPFLVCSGNVNVDTVSAAGRLGALQFIRKPLDLFELQRRLEGILPSVPVRWADVAGPVARGAPSPSRQDLLRRIALARGHLVELLRVLDPPKVEQPADPGIRMAQEALDEVLEKEAIAAGKPVPPKQAKPVPRARTEAELLPMLRLAALDTGAVRLERFLAILADAESSTAMRESMRIALHVELAAFDKRLASR